MQIFVHTLYRDEEVKGRHDVKIWLLRLFLKKVKFGLYVAFIVAYFVTGHYLKMADLQGRKLLSWSHGQKLRQLQTNSGLDWPHKSQSGFALFLLQNSWPKVSYVCDSLFTLLLLSQLLSFHLRLPRSTSGATTLSAKQPWWKTPTCWLKINKRDMNYE